MLKIFLQTQECAGSVNQETIRQIYFNEEEFVYVWNMVKLLVDLHAPVRLLDKKSKKTRRKKHELIGDLNFLDETRWINNIYTADKSFP